MLRLPAVPAFVPPEGVLPGQGNLAADVVAATGLGLAAGGLAYGAVTATGLGILALGAAPIAVGGTVAGGILGVGAFLEVLKQLQEWGLINWRPEPIFRELEPGTEVSVGPGTNVLFSIGWQNIDSDGAGFFCGSNAPFFPAATSTSTQPPINVLGVGWRVTGLESSGRISCGSGDLSSGTPVDHIQVKDQGGGWSGVTGGVAGRVTAGSFFGTNLSTRTVRGVYSVYLGQRDDGSTSEVPEIPDRVRPRLFPPVLPDAPVLPPAPGTLPPIPQLPPPPDRRPLAPPVPIQRPGQSPARPPARPPATPAAPATTPTRVPQRPPAVPLLPGGPTVVPDVPVVTQTPPGVVIVDGVPVGGPGQAPAATMAGLAREVGRIEAKAELAIRLENNSQALGQELGSLLEEIQSTLDQVADELLADDPGGVFTLAPGCPPAGGGEPDPIVEVPIPGSPSRLRGLGERINGLAGLIQQHKLMGQPICRTPSNRSNVTVRFESP